MAGSGESRCLTLSDSHTGLPDQQPVDIGNEIRTIRKARGITLKSLSAYTGVSVAYLSRIERGEARLSEELLHAVGSALNVDPKWFFPRRPSEDTLENNYIVRAADRRPLSQLYTRSADELGFEDTLLSSSLAGNCYMMLTRFPPMSEVNPDVTESYAYEGEQHGIVIEGSIDLILKEKTISLQTGDSFSYPTKVPHRMKNNCDKESVVVITMTPVRINW